MFIAVAVLHIMEGDLRLVLGLPQFVVVIAFMVLILGLIAILGVLFVVRMIAQWETLSSLINWPARLLARFLSSALHVLVYVSAMMLQRPTSVSL